MFRNKSDKPEAVLQVTIEDLKKAGFDRVWKGKYGNTPPVYTPLAPKQGGSFVGTIYAKSHTNPQRLPNQPLKQWMGKLGCFDEESFLDPSLQSYHHLPLGVCRNAIKEKIAADAYFAITFALDYPYLVPKQRLARLPIINEHTRKNDFVKPIVAGFSSQAQARALHLMSQILPGYQDLQTALVPGQNGQPTPYLTHLEKAGVLSDHILVENNLIPLLGLPELLAASRLLGDVNVLGNTGSNTGYIVVKNINQPLYAQVVKIDTGYAFSFDSLQNRLYAAEYPSSNSADRRKQRPLSDKRDIQMGNVMGFVLPWNRLSSLQKDRFIATLKKGLDLLGNPSLLNYLIYRENLFHETGQKSPKKSLAEYQESLQENCRLQNKVYTQELEVFSRKQILEAQLSTSLRIHRNPSGLHPFFVALSLSEQSEQPALQQQSVEPIKSWQQKIAEKDREIESLRKKIFQLSHQSSLPQEEIQKFLHLVTWEANEEKAKAMLNQTRGLAQAYANFQDPSGRQFTSLTGFQYAVWALDWQMWEMIKSYLSFDEAQSQLQELVTRTQRDKSWQYGSHFDLNPLITALRTYRDNYVKWNEQECNKYWINHVGGAQRQLPVHFVQEYACAERTFVPVPDFTQRHNRDTIAFAAVHRFGYEVQKGSDLNPYAPWFENKACAWSRGNSKKRIVGPCPNPPTVPQPNVGYCPGLTDIFFEDGDLPALEACLQTRIDQLIKLKKEFLCY